jgi:hypothetical protein
MKTRMPERLTRLLDRAREPFRPSAGPTLVWRELADVCALADSERHLGHAIRAGERWIAYDAIHFNPTKDGFRIIGTFATIDDARQAIINNSGLSWLSAPVGIAVGHEIRSGLEVFKPSPTKQPRRRNAF